MNKYTFIEKVILVLGLVSIVVSIYFKKLFHHSFGFNLLYSLLDLELLRQKLKKSSGHC
jgi:hypothetical protein